MFKPQRSKFQKKHEWTDDQRRVLAKYAGKEPIQAIAKRLGKTNTAIRNQCSKLGFSFRHPDNEQP